MRIWYVCTSPPAPRRGDHFRQLLAPDCQFLYCDSLCFQRPSQNEFILDMRDLYPITEADKKSFGIIPFFEIYHASCQKTTYDK